MVDWLSSRLNQLGWLMAQHRQYFYDALGRTNGIFNIFDDEYGSDHPAGGIGMCRHDALGRQIKPCADGSPPLAFDGDNIIRALNRRVRRLNLHLEVTMAVWQFDAYLVPRVSVTSSTGQMLDRVSERAFDSARWWNGIALPPAYAEVLSTLLPRGQHWSRDVEFWGREDADCISVTRCGDAVDELRVRIDVRNLNYLFIDRIADVARRWDCVFLTEDLEVTPAASNALQKQLRDSSAYRYLLDPTSFLTQDGQLP